MEFWSVLIWWATPTWVFPFDTEAQAIAWAEATGTK